MSERKRTAPRAGETGFSRGPIEPTSKLNRQEMAEFKRLIRVLTQLGSLSKVDLNLPTQAARIKVMLDDLHEENDTACNARTISLLTAQLRGLLREMGATLQPSRSAVRPNRRIDDQAGDPYAQWRAMLSAKGG